MILIITHLSQPVWGEQFVINFFAIFWIATLADQATKTFRIEILRDVRDAYPNSDLETNQSRLSSLQISQIIRIILNSSIVKIINQDFFALKLASYNFLCFRTCFAVEYNFLLLFFCYDKPARRKGSIWNCRLERSIEIGGQLSCFYIDSGHK